ncbi:MAG: RusA family crossover junction endodeoxyribonuclease [Pseudomonadota bacterium]
MSDSITVRLPWPPSTNNLFAHRAMGGTIRRFPSKTYKRWRKSAVQALCDLGVNKITTACRIEIVLTPPDRRRRDIDNYLKAILDALVEAEVISDDSLIDELSARRELGHQPAGAFVKLEQIEPWIADPRLELSHAEADALHQMKKMGGRFFAPGARPSKAVLSLIDKGYAQKQPGLFPGDIQAIVAI